MASVQQTASVAMPVGAGLVVLQYLTHPVWPPPDAVLTIAAAALAPVAHAAYNGFAAAISRWAAKEEEAPQGTTAHPMPQPALPIQTPTPPLPPPVQAVRPT